MHGIVPGGGMAPDGTRWIACRPGFFLPVRVLLRLHRVANSRLLAMDEGCVTFRWKDYRAKDGAKGKTRHKAMTLSPQEFMRRFLLHVLPGGFHRIRHYGLLANSNRRDNLALARELLLVSPPPPEESVDEASTAPAPTFVCTHWGRAMVVLQVFLRGCSIRAPPAS